MLATLSRRGNCFGVFIPRPLLRSLGWVQGDRLIVEELADGVRLYNLKDKMIPLVRKPDEPSTK